MAEATGAESTNKSEVIKRLFDKISDNFNCPICLDRLKQTCTTVCGHRFCEVCLVNTLQQRPPKCPMCNRQFQNTHEYIRDVTFDALIEEFDKLQEIELDRAVSHVISMVQEEARETYDLQSPLHKVLKDHMAKSLSIHENYLKQIKKNLNNQLKIIDEKLDTSIMDVRNSGLNVNPRIEQLILQADQEKADLKREFEMAVESVATKYSKFLDQTGITPLSLPVNVKLRVIPFYGGHLKEIRTNLELKTYQDIQHVINQLVRHVEKNCNDKILKEPDDLLILNLGPFSNYSNAEAAAICDRFLRQNVLPEFVDVLRSQTRQNCFPIQEYFIKPDSEFIFYGNFIFESDQPKRCFRYTFEKANPKPVDYYICNQCNNTKWICKSCKEVCHKDHNVSVFSLKHQPTWASCYCERTGCCQLNE